MKNGLVSTPATGLEVKDVELPSGELALPAYVARPNKDGRHPVVIVVHEIFGVHAYIRDVCRRLAKEGYYAVAPDLFFRYGNATKIEDFITLRSQIVSKSSQAEVLSDLDALTAWLEGETAADTKRMGITGFCWGGNVTWMYAAHAPKKVKAGVAWYGRLSGDVTSKQPRFPVDVAPSLTVPVLGLYGGKDKGIPLEQVEAMRKALGKSKSGSEIIVYPEAEHAFHADYRPSYDEHAAKAAWSEMLTWLRANGV